MTGDGQAVAAPMAIKAYVAPDVNSYTYDEVSGYYYDPITSFYYDSNSQYYYNPATQQYMYWDANSFSYIVVISDSSNRTIAPIATSTTAQSITAPQQLYSKQQEPLNETSVKSSTIEAAPTVETPSTVEKQDPKRQKLTSAAQIAKVRLKILVVVINYTNMKLFKIIKEHGKMG